jgi:hypothetical protein
VFQEGITRPVVIKQPPNSSCDFRAHRDISGFTWDLEFEAPRPLLPANDKSPPAPHTARINPGWILFTRKRPCISPL